MTDRCPICDRETCKAFGNTSTMEGVADCDANAVDWRQRTLDAEAEHDDAENRLRAEIEVHEYRIEQLRTAEHERDAAMWAHAECMCHNGGHDESNLREDYLREGYWNKHTRWPVGFTPKGD